MNKVLVGILAVVILVAGGWYIFAKNKGASPSATPMPSMSMGSSPASSSSSSPTAASSVKIQNYAFSPAAVTVKKGASVTWTNEDSVGHTVTESDGQAGPSSSTLNQGQSYSFTFNTAGTFHYKCSIHPYMTGTVIVTD